MHNLPLLGRKSCNNFADAPSDRLQEDIWIALVGTLDTP